MTTVIAIEKDNRVEIGCDSKATGGDQIELEQPKVFENNGITIGVAGVALLANELRYGDLPAPPESIDSTDRWMTKEFTPALRSIVEATMKTGDDGEYELQALVIVNGRVYDIGGNLGWVRNTAGTYAIGSGAHFALGALSAGADINQALAIAAKHDPYTGCSLEVTTV